MDLGKSTNRRTPILLARRWHNKRLVGHAGKLVGVPGRGSLDQEPPWCSAGKGAVRSMAQVHPIPVSGDDWCQGDSVASRRGWDKSITILRTGHSPSSFNCES